MMIDLATSIRTIQRCGSALTGMPCTVLIGERAFKGRDGRALYDAKCLTTSEAPLVVDAGVTHYDSLEEAVVELEKRMRAAVGKRAGELEVCISELGGKA